MLLLLLTISSICTNKLIRTSLYWSLSRSLHTVVKRSHLTHENIIKESVTKSGNKKSSTERQKDLTIYTNEWQLDQVASQLTTVVSYDAFTGHKHPSTPN